MSIPSSVKVESAIARAVDVNGAARVAAEDHAGLKVQKVERISAARADDRKALERSCSIVLPMFPELLVCTCSAPACTVTVSATPPVSSVALMVAAG
jgi:hypothetical protein